MNTDLVSLCRAWDEWALTADRSEDGWQSDFPQWNKLMSSACAAMLDAKAHHTMYPQIELCWQVSEETEDLVECARKHIEDCWEVVQQLAHSRQPDVRWQVFSVLPTAGRRGEPLLRAGLNDSDAYCRRRALMALGELGPEDALELKKRFLQDSDAGVRHAAASLKVYQ